MVSSLHLTEKLDSEHTTSLQVLHKEFTDDGKTQSNTFAYWDTLRQGVGTLLRLQEVANGLGNFRQVSHKINTAFVEKRLLVDKNIVSVILILDQRHQHFPTCTSLLTSMKTEKIKNDSEVLFRGLLAASRQRDVSSVAVMKHELAPIQPSLFNNDGTMLIRLRH